MVLVLKWPFFQLFFQPIQAWKMSFMIFQNERTPFQVIKTGSSKRRKMDILLKGLNDAFAPQIASFLTFSFQAIQARKISLIIFQNKKSPFSPIKTRSSKSRKITFSRKGLTHGFGSKMSIFPTFFLSQYRPGKCLL